MGLREAAQNARWRARLIVLDGGAAVRLCQAHQVPFLVRLALRRGAGRLGAVHRPAEGDSRQRDAGQPIQHDAHRLPEPCGRAGRA